MLEVANGVSDPELRKKISEARCFSINMSVTTELAVVEPTDPLLPTLPDLQVRKVKG